MTTGSERPKTSVQEANAYVHNEIVWDLHPVPSELRVDVTRTPGQCTRDEDRFRASGGFCEELDGSGTVEQRSARTGVLVGKPAEWCTRLQPGRLILLRGFNSETRVLSFGY